MTNFTLDFTIASDPYHLKRNDTGHWVILKGDQVLQDYRHLDSAFAAILSAYDWSGVSPEPELFEAIETVLLKHDTKGDN